MPHLKTFNGYRGARFARRKDQEGIEILVLTFWESRAALLDFAG
jgi:heme-degrading monooxygenase HmoA